MQYKIPVHIENEDTIFLRLSLRQLGIIMGGGALAYMLYKSLSKSLGPTAPLFPCGIIWGIFIIIALFKHTEMTFLPFILNLIRMNLNGTSRLWSKWVDSYSFLDIGYVVPGQMAVEKSEGKQTNQTFESIENVLHKL